MNYKISSNERDILKQFQIMRIPSIFKLDNTDRLLFVEDISFTICDWLLKDKDISDVQYDDLMESYERFVKDTDVQKFDNYALKYYNLCLQVVEIMEKCNRVKYDSINKK